MLFCILFQESANFFSNKGSHCKCFGDLEAIYKVSVTTIQICNFNTKSSHRQYRNKMCVAVFRVKLCLLNYEVGRVEPTCGGCQRLLCRMPVDTGCWRCHLGWPHYTRRVGGGLCTEWNIYALTFIFQHPHTSKGRFGKAYSKSPFGNEMIWSYSRKVGKYAANRVVFPPYAEVVCESIPNGMNEARGWRRASLWAQWKCQAPPDPVFPRVHQTCPDINNMLDLGSVFSGGESLHGRSKLTELTSLSVHAPRSWPRRLAHPTGPASQPRAPPQRRLSDSECVFHRINVDLLSGALDHVKILKLVKRHPCSTENEHMYFLTSELLLLFTC